MDSSPLIKAHDHARAAAVATRQAADTTVAVNEHTHAAGEFANAARTTSSLEALRTLKLLEEHHRKLAEILKLPPDQPSTPNDGDLSEKSTSQAGADDVPAAKSERPAETAAGKTVQVRQQQRRIASREMSSSIASNLASARGIRSKYRGQPLSPSVSNDQAPGNLDPHPRRDGSKTKMQSLIDQQSGKPAWVPPMPTTPTRSDSRSQMAAPTSPTTETSAAVADDGGYTRFYNTFGSIINKISAPLAFAGLPLIQEESTISEQDESPPQAAPTKPTRLRSSPTGSSAEPDLSKIYSKATMRALARDGHGAHESFYVVPTSGHTMSYANILSYAEKEKRRLEASGHGSLEGHEEEDDDFVDARETPVPLSPGAKRRVGRARSGKDLNNTIEELYTENKSLKDMLDKLTQRLHAFEASAQNPAMALAESYRVMRPGSPMSPGSGKLGDDVARRRSQETEEQLANVQKQMERLERDNRKMQKTLEKYREKWEVLKAGAKARRGTVPAGESVEDARQA